MHETAAIIAASDALGDGATVGVVESGSTAVLVTLAPGRTLLDRRRVELIEPGLSTHPHHHEGSWAVGRYLSTPGARAISLADAVALVERVRESAVRGARASLDALAASIPVPIARIAIRARPELPPTIEERIKDSRAQTFADSVMYREALATAAVERGWSVDWYDRARVFRDAATAIGREDVDGFLHAMGEAAGPPWQAAHRLAAAAALAAASSAVREIGGRAVTELLGAFADAWNRHDLDALMSMMTSDCVFQASGGGAVDGERHEGQRAVRAAYAAVFAQFPDARWIDARHFVAGDRGVSEWIFVGTPNDGRRIEVTGCDLFTFRNGKIAIKNSFRKNRPPVV